MRCEPYTRATVVLYRLTTIYYSCKAEARYPRFEVLSGDTVSLEIVYSEPPTPAQAKEICRRAREEFQKYGNDITDDEPNEVIDYALDMTDDSYITLDGDEGYMPNHSHPYVTQLFPVRRKVPYLLRKLLERGLENALKENESYWY